MRLLATYIPYNRINETENMIVQILKQCFLIGASEVELPNYYCSAAKLTYMQS